MPKNSCTRYATQTLALTKFKQVMSALLALMSDPPVCYKISFLVKEESSVELHLGFILYMLMTIHNPCSGTSVSDTKGCQHNYTKHLIFCGI